MAVSGAQERVRWSWLWTPKSDLLWNLLPFWLGFPLIAALYLTRAGGTAPNEPGWVFSFAGRPVDVFVVAFILYGPLVDGPHLWATIARTYTDADEWAARRWLFISSLLALLLGPVMILTPYVINAFVALPHEALNYGFIAWSWTFGTYALYHINKQHWGFVSLYKRKNGDSDARESRIDAWFFNTAIWVPYIAMFVAPWDAAKQASASSSAIFAACHAVFLTLVVAYVGFQVVQWRKGVVRNGPKLVYMATILPLYYATFAFNPRVAAFWVLITSTGHCLQYHAVVWNYGTKKYAQKPAAERRLPHVIFDNLWLYLVLGLLYALVTLQGPGANTFKAFGSGVLQSSVFAHTFTFLDQHERAELALKVLTAFISGVRLHHFYVDSKIWRVSKSPALAKNLDLSSSEQARPGVSMSASASVRSPSMVPPAE